MSEESSNSQQLKIERIAQAIYLVSNHLKDNEPLKWELRKNSLAFIACIRSLNDDEGDRELPADLIIDAMNSCVRELTSLLSLAIISGLISRNNGNLIIQEMQSLTRVFKQVVDDNTAKTGFVLSEDFFATDTEITKTISKGQEMSFISDKSLKPYKGHMSDKNDNRNKAETKGKKDNRQSQIIALLKTQKNLTIKDFVVVINDCSEKTIQRELGVLVEKGIIKKEGERRWSTYSLK